MKLSVPLIIALIIVGFSLLFWFEIRPAEIRRQCEAYAGSKIGGSSNSSKRHMNNLYRQCLVKKGLKPESIFVNIE